MTDMGSGQQKQWNQPGGLQWRRKIGTGSESIQLNRRRANQRKRLGDVKQAVRNDAPWSTMHNKSKSATPLMGDLFP